MWPRRAALPEPGTGWTPPLMACDSPLVLTQLTCHCNQTFTEHFSSDAKRQFAIDLVVFALGRARGFGLLSGPSRLGRSPPTGRDRCPAPRVPQTLRFVLTRNSRSMSIVIAGAGPCRPDVLDRVSMAQCSAGHVPVSSVDVRGAEACHPAPPGRLRSDPRHA